MRLSEHQQEFALHVAQYILYAQSIGIFVTFGEAYRTKAQQFLYFYGFDVIYDKILKFIKSNKRSYTMDSNHLKRLAVDFNYFIDGKLTYDYDKIKPLGDFWESLSPHNRWGGNFKHRDVPHIERNI